MLNSSALLRIGVLLIAAGLVAGLVQALLPRNEPAAAPPPARVESAAPEPAKARVPEPTVSEPAPRQSVPLQPLPPQSLPPQPAPQQAAIPAAPPPPAPQPSSPLAAEPDGGGLVEVPGEAASGAPPTGQAAVDSAIDNAGPRAVTLIDLNAASLAELNGLRGGGAIGRAIIAKRPYISVDQLLSKRVLSRATYERIKDQVRVQ